MHHPLFPVLKCYIIKHHFPHLEIFLRLYTVNFCYSLVKSLHSLAQNIYSIHNAFIYAIYLCFLTDNTLFSSSIFSYNASSCI